MLIISGAFGVFRKDAVVLAGGYRRDTIGEDMELVVRMHRLLREKGQPYRIEFVPDPVCWTEAPEDYRTLKNQRIRWQRGLAESLNANWGLVFSRTGGVPGWVAFPFMLLFEWLGPLVEIGGYVFMIWAYFSGMISWAVGLRPAAGRDVLPHLPARQATADAGTGGDPGELRLPPAQFHLAPDRPVALGDAEGVELGHDEAQGHLAKPGRPNAKRQMSAASRPSSLH
jgi:Glycosyl transferase family group 2